MKWLINFLNSSLGNKVLMSLTGLFLSSFLLVHLSGNLQLLKGDGGLAFNAYAHFMTTNPIIKFTSYGLYASILLHAIKGIGLYMANRKAKGQGYKVTRYAQKGASAISSRNMALLGTIVLGFLGLHMAQFWGRMHFTEMPIDAAGNKDLFLIVKEAFQVEWVVIVYLISMIALAFHLVHGFQSAFQTLGLNHKKYTPIIKAVGLIFAIVVPAGFAVLPIYFLLG